MTRVSWGDDWDEECDVLVVGSGGGALTGAYTAAREGLSVIVAEATEYFGGTTAYSGGGLWFPCNAVLKRAGDDDMPEDARIYYHSVVGDRTPVELQDTFLATGPRLVDYLEADDGFEFVVYPWPDYFGSAPQARTTGRHIMPEPLPPDEIGALRATLRPPLPTDRSGRPLPDLLVGGQALIGRLLLALSKLDNSTLRTETVCDELVKDGDAVVGAVVSTGGSRYSIRARRGVLIASGGFERNQEMRDRYGVPGVVADAMGPAGNLGKAILAGIDAGAATDLMAQAWWSPGLTNPDGSSTFSLWFTGGIFVDAHGDRFVNESLPYDRLGRIVIERINEGRVRLPYWMIYDDREGERPPVGSASVPVGQTKDYRDAELWRSADTLEELAEKIGVPADRLSTTVKRFNSLAESGTDEDFHRGDEPYDRFFAAGGSPLEPIEKGPFHAAAFGISDLGTKGGLRTDMSARAVDGSGGVIPGLYAAGNSMAAVSGDAYPGGGNPIGSCMVFSQLAALDMAGKL